MHSSPLAPQEFGHLLGEFNWHKPKAKRLFVIWSLMIFPALVSWLFLVGIPATVLAVYFARRSWKRWRSPQNVVLLYQHGLVDRRKSQPVILSYDDVQSLFITIVRLANVTSYIYTIHTKDNRQIQFDEHLAQIKDIGHILQEQIAQHQLPEAIATYKQGLPVSFKQLTVTSDGVAVGKRFLPWTEFDSAMVLQTRTRKYLHTFIEIKQKNQQNAWALLDQKTFPNVSLFFALLDYIKTPITYDDWQ
jgi:hypothetical protein